MAVAVGWLWRCYPRRIELSPDPGRTTTTATATATATTAAAASTNAAQHTTNCRRGVRRDVQASASHDSAATQQPQPRTTPSVGPKRPIHRNAAVVSSSSSSSHSTLCRCATECCHSGVAFDSHSHVHGCTRRRHRCNGTARLDDDASSTDSLGTAPPPPPYISETPSDSIAKLDDDSRDEKPAARDETSTQSLLQAVVVPVRILPQSDSLPPERLSLSLLKPSVSEPAICAFSTHTPVPGSSVPASLKSNDLHGLVLRPGTSAVLAWPKALPRSGGLGSDVEIPA